LYFSEVFQAERNFFASPACYKATDTLFSWMDSWIHAVIVHDVVQA